MSIVLDGTSGITTNSGTVVSTTDATLNGLTVGKGGGAVSTNTAVGAGVLAANTTGLGNTSVGYQALDASTTSDYHTAVGWNALGANTTGARNTAFGAASLATNSTGGYNVAMGVNAGYAVTTGSNNVAIGYDSLSSNTTSSYNTAVGYQAGYSTSTTGGHNTFVGYQAGYTNTTADRSVYLGDNTGYAATGRGNTYIGCDAGYVMTTGANNTILGRYTGNQGGLDIRTASNYIVLSDGDGNPRFYHNGSFWTSTQLLVPYIYATTGAGAGTVVVGTDGNLFRSSSSARYKKDIVDARYGLSDLLKLRAVNYKGSGEQDTDKLLGGLIAEEVDEAGLQEFVIYDDQKRPDALHYAQMVSLCVKSIQELKTIVDAQASEIAELKAKVGI